MAVIDEISSVVSDIASRINLSIEGKYNGVTNEFCDTKWARAGKKVTESTTGDVYEITGVNYNESMTANNLSGVAPFESGEYMLPEPFFISGTKLAANNEWTIAADDLTQKTPIIWLLEVIRERRYGRGDTRLLSTDLRVFFLDETNVRDFYTADHRREVVYPMTELAEAFLDVVRSDQNFETFEDYELITFSRFGVEQENGMFENILDANLSGVELRFSLTKFKQNCKC